MSSQGRQTLFMILTVLLCLVVLATGVVLCYGYYYSRGMHLRPVDMQQYAKVEMEDEVYTVSVDADAIIKDFHLPNPKNTTLDMERYPDVATIYSLTFIVTPREEGGWHILTGSDRKTPEKDLRAGTLKLVNTEWDWTETDMKTAYRAGLEYPRKLSMKKYVLCGKNSMGGYVLTVDHERMLRATGWDLPNDEATRKVHTGYTAVLSLGYYITPLVQGFLVETSSTLENVYALLLDNGVKLTDTTWTYTLEEVEALYNEQHPPEEAAVPAANMTAPLGDWAEGALFTSLYHVDQTPARRAIQAAREQRYPDGVKSSEIIGSCFAVAKADGAAHGNVFRLVYAIATPGGEQEYLVADLYDLRAGSLLTAADVTMARKGSREEALGIGDLDPNLYTVQVLTDGAMVYPEDNGASPFDGDGLLFPQSLTERITEAEVWQLAIPADRTLYELLGFARNEIFARCGNRFADTSVYTRFYADYPWYQPKGSVSYNTVQANYPVAAENIDFFKAMEKLIKEG